jgi:amidohydrolase
MKGAFGIRASIFAVLLSTLPGPAAAQAQEAVSLQAAVDNQLFESRDELIEIRRDIHRHPEVSGREERTAGVVAGRLRALGLEVRTGVGGHGVVALLSGARPGPIVAFRADMDAVTSRDPDPVDFSSEVAGVRHICGHDIHTAVGLALAEGLAAIRDEIAGSVMFIFQPAEENATGARAMLEDGVFDGLVPDAIFAYHTAPLEVGQVGTKGGVLLAGRDRIKVTLSGRSDLSDAADEAVRLIRETSTIDPSTTSTTGDFAVTNVFGSQAGTADNTWVIRGSATTSSLDASARVERSIRDGLTDLERYGVRWSLEYEERWIAGAANDPALEGESLAPLRSILGEDGVVVIENVPTQFSEDFGSFQMEVPGVMYYLGVSNSEKGWVGLPHSPGYVADERSIEYGARAMAAVILHYFDAAGPG